MVLVLKVSSIVLCCVDVNRRLPGAYGHPGTLNKFIFRTMSRAVLAEAVCSNILYYIHHTKHIGQGSAIACRNFLVSVCFQKQTFPKEAHSARNISQLTNRKKLPAA